MKTKLSKQKVIDSYVGGLMNCGIISLKFLNPLKKSITLKPKTIIIYKLDAIGDSVLSLPMIKHLKEQTKAKIIVTCSKENKDIFKGHNFIDEIITFNSFKLSLGEFMINLYNLRNKKADIAIDCAQSSNISAIFSWLTTKHAIGFKKTRGISRNKVYHYPIDLDPNKHMVLNYFDLLKPLNIKPPKNIKLVKLYSSSNIKTIFKNSIIVHPCNIFSYKTWPRNRWIKVIKYLTKKNHVVIIGSKQESSLVKELLDNKELLNKIDTKNITDLSGKINLRELISLISESKMFVGIDGGPMHIAAAQGIPVIGLFGHETSTRYAPFNKKSIALYKNPGCSPCVKAYNNQSPNCDNPICLKNISTKEVIKAVEELI